MMATNGGKGKRDSCFVVMPFGGLWDNYYAQIYAPAIEEAGLVAVRADEVFRAGSILQDIVDLLVKAAMVLADISETNRNVHYELGLAHALGKPTVLVAPEGMPLFFDVGQERMVTYDKNDAFWGTELRTKVARTIEETMRAPQTAIPTAFMHIKPVRHEADEVIVRLRRIEEQIGEVARIALAGRSNVESRLGQLIKGLPAAEAIAEQLLQTMEPKEVIQRLITDGFGVYMAESAVATAAARARRPK